MILAISLVLAHPPTAASAADDWSIPNGHFFTQTGGGGGLGYSVTDEGDVPFWSEFKRFGGPQGVGYPASQRFEWNGFTCQVFQRVVFQWNPQTRQVQFLNAFDLFTEMGKDQDLLETRQVPPPKQWDEAGLTWEQIVAERTAAMDAYPAIKAAYYGAVGDPVQANGLPTSDVVDMGNHYHLRAQRVTFQLWKEDVPWARAGQVTISLGGDLAKEMGILPDLAALQPYAIDGATAPTPPDPPSTEPTPLPAGPTPPPGTQWSTHQDGEKSFEVPAGWVSVATGVDNYYYNVDPGLEANRGKIEAYLYYTAAFRKGADYHLEDFLTSLLQTPVNNGEVVIVHRERRDIGGVAADIVYFDISDSRRTVRAIIAAYQYGVNIYLLEGVAVAEKWSTYEPLLNYSINTFKPLNPN